LVTYTEERSPCSHRTANRLPLYGDLHIHTSFSFDSGAYGNLLRPSDAYAFAKGQAVKLPPNVDGESTREVQIDRPLDFVGVTDHGEFLGEISLCTTPGSPAYDVDLCVNYRDPEKNSAYSFGLKLSDGEPERYEDICGAGNAQCTEAAKARWAEMQQAAEEHYDKSEACAFTAFASYEYTNTAQVSNLHRNVVFRNAKVPELPVTHFEAPTPHQLWTQLDAACNEGVEGCDVIVIPHNGNLSNGQLFYPSYPGADSPEAERAIAELRARMEPVVEIFQHKGDGECRNGLSGINGDPDPLCDFEKLYPDDADDCGDEPGLGGMRLWGCVHRLNFSRNVFKEGLKEEARIGFNPYKMGVIGSTDSHNATPGHVSSHDFPGHVGIVDDDPIKRLGSGNVTHDGIINNPGGLAAVWAVENSRDAIFEAMRRRETFATSGPRIPVRFFGGFTYEQGLCADPEALVTEGYKSGVPMGGELTAQGAATSPVFMAYAPMDPGTEGRPGHRLQRIEIIKGWLDQDGTAREKVFLVAGSAQSGEAVDTSTCAPLTTGQEELCAVWTDPEFDATQRAFYYARVVEEPSCRWSTMKCMAIPEAERPEGCTDGSVSEIVQHRAWSSPIWVTPKT